MKNSFISDAIIVLLLILYGCASTGKEESSNIRYKEDELLSFENNQLVDPVSNLHWIYYQDNPTTYYRFKLTNNNTIGRLPSIEQLNSLFLKIVYQLYSKKHQGNLIATGWFDSDCNFLASSSVKTKEGEVYYEVLHWDSKTKSTSMSRITGGDLVVVLLINEK